MDNQTLDNVLSGSLDRLIPLPKRVVRLFISSTFTDMTLERNSLMERVYPKLKNYCREQHGLDFQVVDMRWGVRDEATDDHQTVNLCSREIRNCQRMSLGPNFVALIGDKYGFRPLCNRINSSEYRALRRCLIELDINTDFLDTWYKEDLNAVPAEYLLQPISSILKNFTNKSEPELQSVDQKIWQAIQERIHELLLIGSGRLVAQGRLSEQDRLMRYSISVTEREVIEGCLDVNDAKQRCLVYVRSIRDLGDYLQRCLDNLASFIINSNLLSASPAQQMLAPSSNSGFGNSSAPASAAKSGTDIEDESLRRQSDSQPRRASLKIGSDRINLTTSQSQNAAERKVERTRKLLGRYVDLIAENNVWKLDHQAQIALGALKERKLTRKLRLNGKNLNKFEINWHEQDGISLKLDEHKRYLNELNEHFYKNLSSMIRKSSRNCEQQQLKSSGLLGEVLQHSHYACHVSKGFAGRTQELAHLRAYISTSRHHQLLPMFIYGVGGSGKTSFLARSATLISDWLQVDSASQSSPCVISRFCGTTPSSSSMVGVLGSVCRQLQYNFYQFGSLSGFTAAAHTTVDPNGQDNAQLPFGPIPDDFVRLVFGFRQLLDNCRHKLHERRLFVIILDSLEHLAPPANRCSVEVKYSWLTGIGHLPPNVRLIVSCSSESSVAATTWRRDFAYLKGYFMQSYFGLDRSNGPTNSSRCNCPPEESTRLEQRLIKSCTSKWSEEADEQLQLITASAIRPMHAIKPSSQDEIEPAAPFGHHQRDRCWILHIKPLGPDWARRVLQNWLNESGRNLTSQQWMIVEKSFARCSRPIFIKLAFGEVINWKSYSMQSDTRGLTFGSSLLEKQNALKSSTIGCHGGLEEEEDDHLAAPLAKLMSQMAPGQETTSDDLLRWQIICMEQEWLGYLEFKSRESIVGRRDNDAETQSKNQMTIQINGTADQLKSSSTATTTGWAGSSSSSSICHLSSSIDDAICQLFARIEIQHGFLLTKHSLSYLTAARNGICENELEDLLSLDDVVLDDVFQYHLPPVRRIPPLLWARIRSDLPDYMSERDADGTFVLNWHHGQFRDVTKRRYLAEQSVADQQQVVYIHSMMADYFLGKWADKPKPFKCTRQQAQMAAEQLESAIQQSLRDSQSLGRCGSAISPDRAAAAGRLSFGSTSIGGRAAGSSISIHNRLRGGSNQNDQRFQWMQAKADRRVPHQPLFYANSASVSSTSSASAADCEAADCNARRYNLRKLTELPHHLIRAGRFADLASEIFFNYKWLFCSLDALGLQNLLSDFDDATRAVSLVIAKLRSNRQVAVISSPADVAGITTIIDEGDEDAGNLEFLESLMRQIGLLSSAIRLSSGSIMHGQTRMLAPQLLGRLLPVVKSEEEAGANKHYHLAQLLEQCNRDGCPDNSLLPIAHCLQSPEGIQSSSLEGHTFAVMAMAVTNDQRHLLAVSNKFIMWDISTGELSRVIEPKLDAAIMKGLKLSADNKYAIAHTSSNLILLLDILTQQVISYTELATLLADSAEASDGTIKGLELIDKQAKRFIVWTEFRWFMLSVVDDIQVAQRLRLSVKLEFCSGLAEFCNLNEPSRAIHLLRAVEEDENKYLIVLGTQLARPGELFRISTLRVRSCELGSWSLELWSDRIDNISAFCLNKSLSQIVFVDDATNDLCLRRRRQISWSKAKRLLDGSKRRSRPVLSLQMSSCSFGELGNFTCKQDNEVMNQLKAFERAIDDIQLSKEEIESSTVFDVERQTANSSKVAATGAVAIVLLYETFVTVIQLGEDKFKPCQLELPKGVRNIQVEPNRCQMEALVVFGEAAEGIVERYLILSLNRRLLFYLLCKDGGQLMESIEAHGARIVQLLPIKVANSKEECLVASASMDKSVKIWNLSNLAKNSPSLDKLSSSIQSIHVSNAASWAICLARDECAIFNWQTLKLLARVQLPSNLPPNSRTSSRIVVKKCALSSDGQYLCLASLNSLFIHKIRQDRDGLPSLEKIFKLYDLQPSGLVRKLAFFQQDSRMLATIVCQDDVGAERSTDHGEDKKVSGGHSLSRRILVLCFSIPDGQLIYTIDHLTALVNSRNHKAQADGIQSSRCETISGTDPDLCSVRLPALTRDQIHIVTVEFAPIRRLDDGAKSKRTSSVAHMPLQLNVYSSRDGKFVSSIELDEMEVFQQPHNRRNNSSSIESLSSTKRHQPITRHRRCVSISADQFTKLKAVQYLDRQSVVALIDRTRKGVSFIVDLHTRQLLLCTSSWNGKMTSDGRYGLSGGIGLSTVLPTVRTTRTHLAQQREIVADTSGTDSVSLLQLLEMRQCSPIRDLLTCDRIIKSEGLTQVASNRSTNWSDEDDILCGFNWPNDTYVYQCDQRRRRLLLVRLADGQLVANYKLSASLVSLKWANRGLALVAGLKDGSLISLAIVDPMKQSDSHEE